MKIIYPLLQKEVAYLGIIKSVSRSGGTSHHGAWSSTDMVYEVGGESMFGDFGTMAFNIKNCLKFKTIKTTI